MSLEYRFSCPLANGLHARPASILAELASRFDAEISLLNERSGERANACSVLDLVAGGFMHRDICVLSVQGDEASQAYTALVEFISAVLPDCDDELPQADISGNASGELPHVLRGHVDNWMPGLPASAGIAIAVPVRAGGIRLPEDVQLPASAGVEQEIQLYETARQAVLLKQEELLAICIGNAESQIQQALLSLARDPGLHAAVLDGIQRDGLSAARSVADAIRGYSARLTGSGSVYLQERRGDVEDLGMQLLEELTGQQLRGQSLVLQSESIVCAPSLSTSTMLSLDKQLLKGLVLGESGLTSHTVILARSHGIPVVAGITDQNLLYAANEIYVDGNRGVVIADPGENVRRHWQLETERNENIQDRLAQLGSRPGTTADGMPIEIAANIATPAEIDSVLASGADGIGLFRTEMLFASYSQMPDEEEQYRVYSELAAGLDGRRLIIRTLDVGGDKPLPWLPLPAEENPFLGLRGIRLSRVQPELMMTQLRAISRAAVNHPQIWVMAPMLSNTEEARWFRKQIDIARQDLVSDGHEDPGRLTAGCMLEVPSAALQVPGLSEYCDFFSIGSNDLAQYLFAVDRGNSSVTDLYQELHPALLRIMKLACDEAAAAGRWIGICGELASRPAYAPLLVGLGFAELSMSAPQVLAQKQALARCDSLACRDLLSRCIAAADNEAVAELLRRHETESSSSEMISTGIVNLQSEATGKAEAIRELCGLCLLEGRTTDIDALEDDVWAREETYSTGLGHGIAIPHCRSSAISAASLAVLRLSKPIDWQSLDGKTVDTVLLLAMPDSSDDRAHLRIFARLARRLMNEDFRSVLRNVQTADSIVSFLSRELVVSEE